VIYSVKKVHFLNFLLLKLKAEVFNANWTRTDRGFSLESRALARDVLNRATQMCSQTSPITARGSIMLFAIINLFLCVHKIGAV
jgi:hypothetical protein